MILLSFPILQWVVMGSTAVTNITAQATVNDNEIIITETGVARKQETIQKIYCKDVKWYVKLKSDEKGVISKAEIVYFSARKAVRLKDAAAELKSKAQRLNGVSATCNPSYDDMPTVSNLLLLAIDKKTGDSILGELTIDSLTLKSEWYFTVTE